MAPEQPTPVSRDRRLPSSVANALACELDGRLHDVRVVSERSHEQLKTQIGNPQAIVNLARVNDLRRINKSFKAAHAGLPNGGLFVIGFETLQRRRRRIEAKFPRVVGGIYYLLSFVFHRVFSKLPWLKRLYFALTRGYSRPLSRAEVLGRLSYCGFEIVSVIRSTTLVYVIGRKARPPATNPRPSYGPLFGMERVGQGGTLMRVYKFRTMHPYSEYIQEYVYDRNSLAEGGKIRRDFRVTVWGQWLRRLWLDEIPMLINWLKRDLKLVGVRPLSPHFEGLYPADVQERRRKVRPGLVPPYYADLPRTFEEIVASEVRYLDAFERRPWRTDMRYFFRAVYNILVRQARSG